MYRRFTFLFSFIVLLALVLSSCTPAATPTAVKTAEPTKPPAAAPTAAAAKYKEAPMLAELVKAGKLPPVDKRLPEDPLVVKPVSSIGQYGGVWRRAWKGPSDFHAYGRLNYDGALRWPRNPKDPILPNLVSKWEFADGDKTVVLYFRKGLKWSDGNPWTVNDIIFWWEDIETNKDLSAAPHSEWVVNGKPMTLEKVDDYTIKLKFDGPNGLLLRMLAFHGNQWPLNFERFGFYAPKHYLSQFHPKYNTAIKDFKTFNEKADDLNPERPAMTPWVVTQYKPGDAKLIATRNPYYWKVDPEGNQYPYIDQIELTLTENNDAIAAKALSCEIDNQTRSLALTKYPLFKENEKKCDYTASLLPNAQGTAIAFWPNQSYSADPELKKIFSEKNFRIALSHAIDRAKINKIAFLDQGTIRSELVVPASAFFVPEVEKLYTEYDPKKAGELLDGLGLKMGPDGKVRVRSDGKPLEITIETDRTGTDLDAIQIVKENWDAIGVKTAVKTMTRDLYWPRATGNEVQIAVWSTDRGLEPFVDPIYVFPFDERSWMAPAYGTYFKTAGKQGEKPVGKLAEAQDLFMKFATTVDAAKQIELGKQLIKMAAEEAWTISTVGMVPSPIVVKNNFMNYPLGQTQDWIFMSPGNLDPFQMYFKK
jgi:peptide/nickel transport system substrate-binding protein